MLYFETVDLNTLELLRRIQSHSIFSGTRLVGGTALALQIGHRKSIDLDFYKRQFSDGACFPVLKSLVFFARLSAEAFRGSRVQ
jgi:hypothetical protein